MHSKPNSSSGPAKDSGSRKAPSARPESGKRKAGRGASDVNVTASGDPAVAGRNMARTSEQSRQTETS
jgi:hypothetical protein